MDESGKSGVHSVSNQLKHEWETVPFLMDTEWEIMAWNIMLPWNRVLTSSISIFQTSREHVLVVLTVCVSRANRI
jgi:hypothetical protein